MGGQSSEAQEVNFMRRGRPLKPLKLTANEEATLTNWERRPKSAQAIALRARMILACGAGLSSTEVATKFRVTKQTVCKWRGRFLAKRLEGLLDEPRPGAPRKILDKHVEKVVVKTLETLPVDATHWSTRSMAR